MAAKQIATRFTDGTRRRLTTELVERPLREPGPDEAVAEMLFVPIHGSFWLASHPDVIHPRSESMLKDGGFVFGNGGVARIVHPATGSTLEAGDIVAVFGHMPCRHPDCRACAIDHRYTECEYGESHILGHGAGAPAGTYASHVVLPSSTYELAARGPDGPAEGGLRTLMYAFLVADVRNALTRDANTLHRRRMLLIGAGQSGRIAAALLLDANPDARIVVVDSSRERADELTAYRNDAIRPVVVLADAKPGARSAAVAAIRTAMREHFDGRLCDLVFDGASGNTISLWMNSQVLAPGAEAVAFGFGSDDVTIDRSVLQVSGLSLRTSRGVGSVDNRKQAVKFIKDRGSHFLDRYLCSSARRLRGLDEAITFIRSQQSPPRALHEIPQAYIQFEERVS